MLSFTVNKPRQTLERQWAFLLQKGQDNKRDALNKFFIGLLLATAVYALFYFLTAVNAYVIFKGVALFAIALAWCVLAILYPLSGLGKTKKRRRLQQFLDSISDAQLSYSVVIDDEKVVIGSNGQTQELPWTDFTHFGVHDETLYVYNAVKGINSLYWDKSEIGKEAYSALLEMLKKKAMRRRF